MSVATEVRAALQTLIATELSSVQVSAYPPVKNQDPKESVWFEQSRSVFEWRSIGAAAKNRTEDLDLDVVVHVYRENADHQAAALAAETRIGVLIDSIESAIATGGFNVGGTITQARIGEWTVTPAPMEKGWTFTGRATLTGRNYP